MTARGIARDIDNPPIIIHIITLGRSGQIATGRKVE